MKRFVTHILILAVSVLLAGVPAGAAYASGEQAYLERNSILSCDNFSSEGCVEEIDKNPQAVTINGRTFTKADGLEKHTIEVDTSYLGNGLESRGSNRSNNLLPYNSQRFNWGTSYVWNREIGYFDYFGEVYCGANVYGGKRIISVTIAYKQGGRNLGSATSNAVAGYNGWRSGFKKIVHVKDSFNPSA